MFRAYIPFHSQARLHLARIDLALTATDFLMAHAARNLLLASVTGMVLLGLAVWGMYSTRRRMELEHLAHLGTMSAVLAHEIRNPLGTIKGFVQLAGEKAGDSVTALLAPVLSEVWRLERLVNDLLQYAKPCIPALRPTEWRTLAAEIEAYARDAIADRPAAFRWDGEPWRFTTDPDLLKEALVNLTRNAVESGASDIRLSAANGTIAVEDNGPGIADSVRSRLFQPFVTTKAAGTGLGLSIARKLVEALGGELVFLAVEPHGTRAEVRLGRGTHTDYR
jgi:two-component system sensor histidine kinase HydH